MKTESEKLPVGSVGRGSLYRMTSKHAKKAIEVLVELLESKHPNYRLGAAKIIINKCLPDLKATEVKGLDGLTQMMFLVSMPKEHDRLKAKNSSNMETSSWPANRSTKAK